MDITQYVIVVSLDCQALLASKICSYAQGMNVIKAKSAEQKWNINLGGLARIWKVKAAWRCLRCSCVLMTG